VAFRGKKSFGRYLQASDKCVVGVEIRNQLESTIQGNNLPFNVFLQDANFWVEKVGSLPISMRSLRDEADANFLIEYFQYFLARAALHQFTVKFQTLNCLTTPDSNAQIQRLILRRVIFTGLCLRDNDMFNLISSQGRPRPEVVKLYRPGSSVRPFRRLIRQLQIRPGRFRTASSLVQLH
jgi:hypothetical protein